mmetsp:Transcript_645/g.2042  ORF Transcript_645/g.2042 Transcript_645/m.2042 type:complete len:307 (-) Transcript_645:257-1177(-)
MNVRPLYVGGEMGFGGIIGVAVVGKLASGFDVLALQKDLFLQLGAKLGAALALDGQASGSMSGPPSRSPSRSPSRAGSDYGDGLPPQLDEAHRECAQRAVERGGELAPPLAENETELAKVILSSAARIALAESPPSSPPRAVFPDVTLRRVDGGGGEAGAPPALPPAPPLCALLAQLCTGTPPQPPPAAAASSAAAAATDGGGPRRPMVLAPHVPDPSMLSHQTIEGSCYLLFSEANGGSFWLHWSRTPVGGALASFAPAVDVAAHKYSTNHGKAELCCDVGGPDVKKFYAGWASFIKMAKGFGGV